MLKAATLRPGRERLEKGIVMEKNGDSTFFEAGELPALQECEKIKDGIDVVRVVFIEQLILFQAGKDGIFAHPGIGRPFLDGDHFALRCGFVCVPAHSYYLPFQHVVIRYVFSDCRGFWMEDSMRL